MGCQGCSRRKDSNSSDRLEGADGSLVGEQEQGAQEPTGPEDHNNDDREEQHYEAPMVLQPEHNYSR